ncbi:MAG: DUF4271 domain-containing protein [Flavobacterium sp.]|nr:MAG: DUF4271 domain-containing protein [Flavobacterium sp.]
MQDTVLYRRVSRPQQNGLLDSVAAASVARHQFVSDSLAMIYIQHQDPLRKNQFVEEMLKNNVYKGYGFLDIKTRSKAGLGMGQVRKIRDSWMLGIVAGLLLYAALLRLFLTRDIGNIVQSFYDKQLSSPPDNDTKTLSLWAFLGLLILFGLTFGLFLYQISAYYQVYYTVGGTALYFSLAGGVVLLFCLKLLLLKFLGFVFSINKVVDRYITILCFTYFAITFVFLPVVVCLCLLTVQLIPFILLIAILLTAAILVWLYLRNSLIIISHFQFSKFYLFVYLCALEICPILILMKALNI